MCSQIITIGIGLVFIFGGLSGELVLRGTGSGPLLALVGLILVIYGTARIASNSKKARASSPISAGIASAQPASEKTGAAVDGKPIEIPVAPNTQAAVYADLPDAREFPTDKKALLLINVLQTRKQEVRKDPNSIAVENMDRYLKNFPIKEDELQSIQQSMEARREELIANQEDAAKIAQVEQMCGFLQEFRKIRFRWPTVTSPR